MRISRLFPYLRRHRPALVVGLIAIVAGDSLLLAVPWLMRQAIDALQATDLAGSRRAALLMLAAVAGGALGKFVMRRWMIGASRRIEQEIRADFAAHVFRFSASEHDRHRVGDLMALATNDLNAIRMVLGPGIMYLANTFVTMAVALFLMLSLQPKLTLIAVAPLPLLVLCVQQGSRLVYKRFAHVQEQFAELTSFAQEALTGIRVIKAYAREPRVQERFDEQSASYVDRNISFFRVQALMRPTMSFLAGLAAALTLFFGGRLVIEGQMTVGTLVAFLLYLALLSWPAIAAGWTINIWQRGLASLDRMGAILDTQPSIASPADPVTWDSPRGDVVFERVTFRYPTASAPSLEDVSVHLPAGKWTAIVGPTGAGKSTLLRLLCRAYEGYEGSIRVDGHDLRALDLAQLRGAMGYAPQDGFLFSDTLRENILFGAPDLDDEQLDRLAQISRLERDREAFPDGWETRIGERGVTLSGGQKQRVSIARALAPDPVLLLLDDVFSSVDTETEDELLAQLRQVWQGRTVVLVTHRLLGVQEADQILVLDEGRVVEQGNHDTLMPQGGLYARLFQKQQAKAEIDALGDER